MEAQTMLESQITTNDKLPNIHPGEILKEEFLVPMNISAYRLAKEINIPQTRISEIIHGNRSITADTAIRFSKFFGTTAEFWLNLQNLYDLEEEENNHAPEFETIKMYAYASYHITKLQSGCRGQAAPPFKQLLCGRPHWGAGFKI